MSSEEIVLSVKNLSKHYEIYEKPSDRLKQFIFPKVARLFGGTPKKYYREFAALDNVSFDIKKGETVGIIGRNGSGKSTLLQIICGTLFPSNGEIFRKGRISALLELGSGFNLDFTGKENIYLNASILGLSKTEIDERYAAIVEFADIGDFINQKVKTYSSGMFVRLAFAIHANIDPEILIVDEALAVGDAYFVHRCMLRFRELQKVGTTILLVTHDANAIRSLCTNALWLNSGVIVENGNPLDVVESYLADLYGHDKVDREQYAFIRSEDYLNCTDLENIETEIPNVDRRIGDLRCQIVGVGLYDENFKKIHAAFGEGSIYLRLSIKNLTLPKTSKISVGYIFNGIKGLELASSNSIIEGHQFSFSNIGSMVNVKIKISLPHLYPGYYSLSPTLGYVNESNGIIEVSDRIDNALVFEILSSKEIHTVMSLPSEYHIEHISGGVDV